MPWSPPLNSQRPARKKKKSLFGLKKSRNTYRQRSTPGNEKKKFWGKLLLVKVSLISLVALCLGLVLVYYHLLTSPFFCIKDNGDIDFNGTKRLSAELILHMSGLGPGTNLLALRPTRVEQALAAHPWIAKAELTRLWPNRLRLVIVEREPVALVQLGELHYIDRKGNLFKPLSPGDPHDFPVITGFKREQFAEGQGFPPAAFDEVIVLLDLLKQTEAPLNLANISEIHVDQERGFTLYANGLKSAVHLGPKNFPEKLQKFASIWPMLKQRGYQSQVDYINLDYPQRVLLSLKGSVEEPVGRAQ
jgi:cell division septal protein FtsQ